MGGLGFHNDLYQYEPKTSTRTKFHHYNKDPGTCWKAQSTTGKVGYTAASVGTLGLLPLAQGIGWLKNKVSNWWKSKKEAATPPNEYIDWRVPTSAPPADRQVSKDGSCC